MTRKIIIDSNDAVEIANEIARDTSVFPALVFISDTHWAHINRSEEVAFLDRVENGLFEFRTKKIVFCNYEDGKKGVVKFLSNHWKAALGGDVVEVDILCQL